jgi:hypothetical protein
MNMTNLTRRQVLGSAGLTAGVSLLTGYTDVLHAASSQEEGMPTGQPQSETTQTTDKSANLWRYAPLTPSVVAEAAYRQFANGGCMYGLFVGIMTVLANEHDGPYRSFPFHMMKYGAGGVGNWGSLCGTLNGGAAIIGLFERDKQRCEDLIAELFSWYEAAELPAYGSKKEKDSLTIPKSVAGSILCHASVGKWCKSSGNEMGSPEMKERCRRLTADVAAKTVELLNANLNEPCKFSGLSAGAQSCLSCHGKELHDTLGKMRCNACHQQLSKKHPAILSMPLKSSDPPRQPTP